MLFLPASLQPKPAPKIAKLEKRPSEKQRIRAQTEYEGARRTIDIIYTLSLIGSISSILLGILVVFEGAFVSIGFSLIAGAIPVLAGIVISREALQALFDIADCALLQNKNSK